MVVSHNGSLGNLFNSLSQSLEIYKTYINNYDIASAFLEWTEKQNTNSKFTYPSVGQAEHSYLSIELSLMTCKELTNFIAARQKDYRHTQLNIYGYLVMPVQRVPRYKMLLESLLNNTCVTHDDYNNINSALLMISNVLEALNESKRAWEKEMSNIINMYHKVKLDLFSLNVELLSFPPLTRKYLKSTKLHLIKYVDLSQRLKAPLFTKNSQVRKVVYRCSEYEFNRSAELTVSESGSLVHSKWDISGLCGTEVNIHLFNDMLLICCNDTLICAQPIGGPICSFEMMILNGYTGAIRLCDGFSVIYFKGGLMACQAWAGMIKSFSDS
jgi:hypothetical protein